MNLQRSPHGQETLRMIGGSPKNTKVMNRTYPPITRPTITVGLMVSTLNLT